MKAKFFLFLFLVLYAPKAFSQAENNNWYYGSGAGLNFYNNTTSVLLNNPVTYQFNSGAGTISNKVTGEPLFITDGKFVFNKNFAQMPNSATGQIGPSVNGQSGLIVPSISNRNQYYVFTLQLYGNLLSYSKVDMSLDSGLGDIIATEKGIALNDENGNPFAIRALGITVAPNTTGDAYWILYPNNNKLYAYKVTGTGLVTTPVVSNMNFTANFNDSSSYLSTVKVNSAYNKIGITLYGNIWGQSNSQMRVYDFNNSTGVVTTTNAIAFNGMNIREFEFSPNGTVLYFNTLWFNPINDGTTRSYLYKYDMTLGNTGTPSQMAFFDYTFPADLYKFFQRTPNNDVYFSRNGLNRYISRFSNVNNFSLAAIDANFLYCNPDYPTVSRYADLIFPQLVPKLDCALYEDLKGNNITNTYSYQVSDRIVTSGDYTINNGQVIILYAGNHIVFKANTHLKSGSTVLARIQACSGGSSKMSVESSFKDEKGRNVQKQLILLPNPATNIVTIKSNQSFNKITVTSLDGKLVKYEVMDNTVEYSLDISEFSKGIYLISVTSTIGDLITQKLVKN